jgi:hypothetical protein
LFDEESAQPKRKIEHDNEHKDDERVKGGPI